MDDCGAFNYPLLIEAIQNDIKVAAAGLDHEDLLRQSSLAKI